MSALGKSLPSVVALLLAGLLPRAQVALAVPKPVPKDLLRAAREARRAGDYPAAEKYLREYQERQGATRDFPLERAFLQAQRGDLAPVERVLRSLIDKKEHPQDLLALEALGRGYLETYHIAEALDCFRQWVDRDPKNAQALFWRGEVKRRLPNPAGALEDYDQALKINPKYDEARLRRAQVWLEEERVEDALKDFRHLRKQQPDNPEVLLGLARCRLLRGEDEAAREQLTGLLKKEPQFFAALVELGKLELRANNPAQAERWLRKALRLQPSDHQAGYLSYLCLTRLGKGAEARKQLARLRQITEDTRRLEKALRGIGTKSSDDPQARCEIGVLCLRLGRVKEGLLWLRDALQADPRHRPTHRALAEYYHKSGKKELAAKHRQLAGP
jgi:tetratricopeptide (TPR) repeat protein